MIYYLSVRELSSVGRATALQAVGHRFEPCSSHQTNSAAIMREWLSGRASPCQGECRGFESRLPLQKILPHCIFLRRYSQVVRPRSAKPLSPGSNPGGASNQMPWRIAKAFKLNCCPSGGIGRRKGLKIFGGK